MDQPTIVALIASTALLSACEVTAPNPDSVEPSAEVLHDAHNDQVQVLPFLAPQSNTTYSGKWLEQNGARVCDGFLTRRADEDFCMARVPDDWVAFKYDEQIYYVQPLSETRRQ